MHTRLHNDSEEANCALIWRQAQHTFVAERRRNKEFHFSAIATPNAESAAPCALELAIEPYKRTHDNVRGAHVLHVVSPFVAGSDCQHRWRIRARCNPGDRRSVTVEDALGVPVA